MYYRLQHMQVKHKRVCGIADDRPDGHVRLPIRLFCVEEWGLSLILPLAISLRVELHV